jgi:hypothetical protein
VLPFFLHREEVFGVSRRYWLFELQDCLADFVGGVGQESLEGALVDHGDDSAFNCSAQEFGAIHGVVAFPALGLRVDVGKEFGQRFEFDEAVEREGDGLAIF